MSEILVANSYTINKGSFSEKLSGIYRRNSNNVNRVRLLLNDIFSYYFWLRHYGTPPFIELETLNRCNMTCTFCPVNVNDDSREYNKMSDSLIEKIASELEEMNFSGKIFLYANNEPLLDDRIVDVCRLIRKKASRSKIIISTNGVLINKETYLGLFEAGLDEMVIDNYNDKLTLIKPVARLLDDINPMNDPKIEKFKSNTRVFLRLRTEVLNSKGGFSPNKKKEDVQTYLYYKNHSCPLPFIEMVITPSGEVSLCNQDALGKVVLGDVSKQSIKEVWNGNQFREVRRKLMSPVRLGRKSLNICDGCDFTPLQNVGELFRG
jgi:radical SAM protein with 4Fe4S-binding SPASM domain